MHHARTKTETEIRAKLGNNTARKPLNALAGAIDQQYALTGGIGAR